MFCHFQKACCNRLGEQSGAFESIATLDCSLINADYLKNFDGLVSYTTGELPLSEEQKQALLDFIKSGKGFVSIHSGAVAFYQWPEYAKIIGAILTSTRGIRMLSSKWKTLPILRYNT